MDQQAYVERTKKELLRAGNKGVAAEWLSERLRCEIDDAQEFLRLARMELADDGYKVSYPTASNGFVTVVDGDTQERTESYITRMKDNNTRAINLGRVTRPSAKRGNPKLERAVATYAQGEALIAQGQQQQLKALEDAVKANATATP